MDRGDEIPFFVRYFYGSPSTYLWEDEMGMSHEIAQGEGGEQGDLLMPMLFALGLWSVCDLNPSPLLLPKNVSLRRTPLPPPPPNVCDS